jgi:hypothetical protein
MGKANGSSKGARSVRACAAIRLASTERVGRVPIVPNAAPRSHAKREDASCEFSDEVDPQGRGVGVGMAGSPPAWWFFSSRMAMDVGRLATDVARQSPHGTLVATGSANRSCPSRWMAQDSLQLGTQSPQMATDLRQMASSSAPQSPNLRDLAIDSATQSPNDPITIAR